MKRLAGGYFYSHAPRGARPKITRCELGKINFYSHAPRGARHPAAAPNHRRRPFLLTRPSRGAALALHIISAPSVISTHTPLAGRGMHLVGFFFVIEDFYSHAPRGARHNYRLRSKEQSHFYSHAPRGARLFEEMKMHGFTHFYSHAPRGARPYGFGNYRTAV